MNVDLTRFLEAQKKDYNIALSEITNGKKTSHWMWYIFPQISGLGFSETAKFYAIKDINEAEYYLNDEILGKRILEITSVLNDLKENNANKIFGYPDDLKLKSSMTLFYITSKNNKIFKSIIDKYFDGDFCENTIQLLKKN